jgi:hypothetical protein
MKTPDAIRTAKIPPSRLNHLSVFACLSLFCFALPGQLLVRAEEIAVSGEIVGVEVVDPGEFTITPGGIVIARGVGDETLTGDLAGTMRVTSTFIGNINTGEGILFGTIDWKDPNSDGGFRGHFFGQVSGAFGPGPGEFDGQWQLHGYGARRGETALIDNFGPFSLPQVYEGVIRVPGGH